MGVVYEDVRENLSVDGNIADFVKNVVEVAVLVDNAKL